MLRGILKSKVAHRMGAISIAALVSLSSVLPAHAATSTGGSHPQTVMYGPLSCVGFGECVVGDIGAGGGVVFSYLAHQ